MPRAGMADLFDGIVMAEERFHGEGYQEGLEEGSHAGMAEGRRCGALHGARVGSEFQGENAKQQPPELDGFVQNGPGQTIREKCSDLLMLGKLQKEAGLETSSERTAWIGYYLGFALTWHCLLQKCTDEKNSKRIKALDSLIGMIQKFPYEDPTYDKLQEDLERIRGKFKQPVLSLRDHLSAESVEYGILLKGGYTAHYF
ncbi:oral cancer-overexpressed protein 1 [Turdus rufiventris]|nr:oral cancer-overexpressed protein 1 [Turdus rufiventris]